MSIFYTGDWHAVGADFYRKVELYSMGWTSPQVDIENYSVVGASYGGPLAIIRDDKKIVRVTQNIPPKPIISIYTAAGTLISQIKVSRRRECVGWGFNSLKYLDLVLILSFKKLAVGLWSSCENGMVVF